MCSSGTETGSSTSQSAGGRDRGTLGEMALLTESGLPRTGAPERGRVWLSAGLRGGGSFSARGVASALYQNVQTVLSRKLYTPRTAAHLTHQRVRPG